MPRNQHKEHIGCWHGRQGQALGADHKDQPNHAISANPTVAHNLQHALFRAHAAQSIAGIGKTVFVQSTCDDDRRSHRQKDRQLRCQKQVAQHKNQPRHGPNHQPNRRIPARALAHRCVRKGGGDRQAG